MTDQYYSGNWENLLKYAPSDPDQRIQFLNEYCAVYLTERGWRCIPPMNTIKAKVEK